MKNLRLQSIRSMLVAIVVFATLLAVVIGGLAHLSLAQVRQGGDDVVDRAKPAIALGTTRTAWAEFTSITAGKITINSTAGKADADEAATAAYQQLQQGLKDYLAASPGAEQKEIVQTRVLPAAEEAGKAWTEKVKPLTDVVNPDGSDLVSYSQAKANVFDTPAFVVSTGLQQVAELDAAAIDTRIASAADVARRAVIQMWALAGIGALLILALGVLLLRRITRPLRRTVEVLEQVAGGDLTPRLDVSSPSELAQMADALNTTLGTVHDVIEAIEADAGRLYDVAERVSAESEQAGHTLSSLSRGVQAARSSSETLRREVGQLSNLATTPDLASAIDRIASHLDGLRSEVGSADVEAAAAAATGGADADGASASADLASMAGNLNAMISLFVLRQSEQDTTSA
ncbi:MAG: HAMP domain-containing protein [Kineosporiaceae bacterium]